MPNRFEAAAIKAAGLTNKQLADEMAAISNINRQKLDELLPTKKDKESYARLMANVESDTTMDEKVAYLGENLKTAGAVVVKLLKALV
jgi:N-acetylglucosamine kinase-like BadF-type ATPase